MLKRVRKLKTDQKGSSLILVIFCMVFVGMLASAVLTATVSNMKMKTVDAFAKDNFYDAEKAMDELKVGLEEIAQEKLKEAYAFMLNKYTVTPDTERAKQMRTKWADLFFAMLAEDDSLMESELEDDFLQNLLITSFQASVNQDEAKVVKDFSLSDPTVIIKNISLTFTDQGGYETTITTDLRFAASSTSLTDQATSRNGIDYTDFSLISDEYIMNASYDVSKVYASIYGGKGICAKGLNSEINLTSNKVISRNNLEAIDKGYIQVNNIGMGESLSNQVWVKNIVTSKTLPWADTEIPHDYLNIYANCYVADDITLNARGGNVIIKGNYYGFNSDIPPVVSNSISDASSSIIVNAGNATLDLSNLNRLWIAGKNFLSVPDIYGSSFTSSPIKIAEGEALTFKGTQIAYLVPGDLILGVGHNPMTKEEYDTGFSIDISVFEHKKYLHPEQPFKLAKVNFISPTNNMQMVYLYFNFLDENHASDYFRDYVNNGDSKDNLVKIADDMKLGSILLPSNEKIMNTGNIVTYNGSGIDVINRNEDFNDNDIKQEEITRTIQYISLTSYLQLKNTMIETPSLVKTLIRYDDEWINGIPYRGIISRAASSGGIVYESGTLAGSTPSNPYNLVADSANINISTDSYGIIITTKDVNITNCKFTGMIITTKNINLGAGSEIRSDATNIKNVIENDENLYEIFRDYDLITSRIDSSMISMSYENWHKN